MSPKLATLFTAWSSFEPAVFLEQTAAVAESDVRKLIHDPVELLTRMVQPVLWLVVFGQVFARTRAIPTGGLRYLDFMAPGVLAQSVLFGAIFYGISLIGTRSGRDSQVPGESSARTALVLGRAASSAIRGLCQAFVVYLLAFVLGVRMRLQRPAIVGVIAVVFLGAATFSTFSLIAACIVKSRERFMGIGQVLTMPLFFASNAIYPLSMMPAWPRSLSAVNPLTYQVDALRYLMVQEGRLEFGLAFDFGVQFLVLALLIAVTVKLYPNIIR
jgi:ABC-2 type transport system permease protein